ncbi:interferon-induced protein 44-like [Neosynchiropus ocellatus]
MQEGSDSLWVDDQTEAGSSDRYLNLQVTGGRQREDLMTTICAYSPNYEFVTQARVLLLGPVGSGKSSFISSVQSVLNGRVTNRAMVGTSPSSFTKKLQSFNLLGPPGDEPTGLVICDMMGLESEVSRLSLHDILSVIKGHVPEGHKFTQHTAITPETPGYVKKPGLQERIHCVAFVVDASQLIKYPKSLSAAFAELREHISDLGVHQVALLTNVDKVCNETLKDTSLVYKSAVIRDALPYILKLFHLAVYELGQWRMTEKSRAALMTIYEEEEELSIVIAPRVLIAQAKKLFVSLEVWERIDLYRLPDGSRSNRGWAGREGSAVMALVLLRQQEEAKCSRMHRAAALLGMSTSYVVPVRNYSSELSTDLNTDILLLKAVDHILHYVELYFLDNCVRKKPPQAVSGGQGLFD